MFLVKAAVLLDVCSFNRNFSHLFLFSATSSHSGSGLNWLHLCAGPPGRVCNPALLSYLTGISLPVCCSFSLYCVRAALRYC